MRWLREESLTLRGTEPDIHLVGTRGGLTFEVWLDRTTYLPTRALFGNYRMALDWLPATSENMRLFEHNVPPLFQRREGPTGVAPTK